jgi:MoaA/NifB/PqqE/SkfB family radical SAM enzyme
MSDLADIVRDAIADGRLGPRMWLYSNYHCNLACRYCLTESSPTSERRGLDAGLMRTLAAEGAALGFSSVGVTGGEPFLRRDMPALLAELSELLPVVVLTNGTAFAGGRIERLEPMLGARVSLQISLDSAEPDGNDAFRAPGNFATVVETIPRLLDRGHRVRVATTCADGEDEGAGLDRLRALLRELGVAPEDHVVRPTVARGRAAVEGLGEAVSVEELPAEATWTVDGLFWSPFGPTVRGGRLQTDLLVSRRVLPAAAGMAAFMSLLDGTPANESSRFR